MDDKRARKIVDGKVGDEFNVAKKYEGNWDNAVGVPEGTPRGPKQPVPDGQGPPDLTTVARPDFRKVDKKEPIMEYLKSIQSLFFKHESHTGAFCPGKNHIRNAWDRDIWVFIDCNQTIVKERNAQLEIAFAKGSYSDKSEIVRIAQSVGFTKIPPDNEPLLFRPGHADVKYVSVFFNVVGDICGSFSIGCNDSCKVIGIDGKGYIKKVPMGET